MVVAKLLLNQIKKNINQLEPDEKDTPTVTAVVSLVSVVNSVIIQCRF